MATPMRGQDGTHAHAVEGLAFEVLVGDQRRVAVHDQLGVLQADKGHEQADAHADRALQGHGMALKMPSRTLVRDSTMKMMPSTKTAIRANCQL